MLLPKFFKLDIHKEIFPARNAIFFLSDQYWSVRKSRLVPSFFHSSKGTIAIVNVSNFVDALTFSQFSKDFAHMRTFCCLVKTILSFCIEKRQD